MRSAVILAGGKGTRLASRLNGKPKPLVQVGGMALLQRQLLSLKEAGINEVYLLINHLASQIRAFCRQQDNFGMNIHFVEESEPAGTAGAVLSALDLIPCEDILVIYGDTLFNIDLCRFLAFHSRHDAAASIFLHPNSHPADSDLVELDSDGLVSAIHPYPHPGGCFLPNLVNAALYCFQRKTLAGMRRKLAYKKGMLDFGKNLFPAMLKAGLLIKGYQSPEYIRDVGTPERLDAAEIDINSGKFANGSLRFPQKAVFLDRDGVINAENGFIKKPEQFILLEYVAETIATLNKNGYLCVVVTNQPVLARGECDEKGLAAIHAKMDTLLGCAGAYVDRLYYCPHHPDSGFEGERPELKIKCACRKPETGLIEKAQREMNIDLRASWLVGDSTADILAANRAGLRSILVKTGCGGQDGKYSCQPDFIAADLASAARIILS